MLKKMLCLICLLIDIIFISKFIIYMGGYSLIIFGTMISLSIVCIVRNRKIKNFILRVLTDILIVFTFLLVIYFITNYVIDILNPKINITFDFLKSLVLIVILIYLFITHLFDIKKEVSNKHFIITTIISIITILIYLNYYVNQLFYHNNVGSMTDISMSYEYIYQNYIYFIILYGCLLINYICEKK